MYLKIILKGIKRTKNQQVKYLLLSLFFLLITFLRVDAQSTLIDSIWQTLPLQDSVSKEEQFFLHLKKIQRQLKNSDIIYAITIGLNTAHEEQNPKNIMACYELAGDLYDANPSMQLNALFHYNRALEYAKQLKKIDQQIDVSLKMAWLYAKLYLPEKAYLLARKAEDSCNDQKNGRKIPHTSNYLRRIGDCYIASGKRREANVCFQRALKDGFFFRYPGKNLQLQQLGR